ncbi:MAG: MYXO-CTERM sorting domain-containing protein [Kofleriaceae bacterium]
MKPKAYFRRNWIVVAVALVIAGGGCGGGCSGCGVEPIPGGFDFAKRTQNAGQVRVTTSGFSKITADPGAVLGPLIGGGSGEVITFPAPVSCGGNTPICCDGNGNAIPNCGPIDIDLAQQAGDQPRLVLTPSGTQGLAVTVRARIKTVNPLSVSIFGVGCTIAIDTTKSGTQDVTVTTTIAFSQNATTGETEIAASGTNLANLDKNDLTWGGNPLCGIGSVIDPSTLSGFLVGPIQDQLNTATCRACDAATTCGPGATCQSGTCTFTAGGKCEQELGIDGLMRGSSLFGSLSPGTTGGLELYEVAGGYSITNEGGGGLSLGLYGGMEPGGSPRDMCGPASPEPTFVPTVARSNFFNNNTRPDTNTAYDVGIGLHKSQIAQLATGGYNGGLFCLTIGHNTVAQLTTDTIGLLSRSLGNLVDGPSPMAIGLRPQSAPIMKLGTNTFTDNGGTKTLTDPLLDITFQAMEIDFFASVDDQYVRVFTVVADVHLPVGLEVGADGSLTPVLGDVSNAFSNVSVKNSEAVTESPSDLAALFPSLLNLVLPQLSGGLSPINLPTLGGLALSVTDITAVDDKDGDGTGDFLAIYANLVPNTMARTVSTTFDIASVEERDPDIMKQPKMWKGLEPPAITLSLGATGANAGEQLEYQIRIDDGSWTPWSTNAMPRLALQQFWLPGIHHIDARARLKGIPNSADRTPRRLAVPISTDLLPSTANAAAGFHGQSGAQGCACDSSSSGTGVAVPFALVLFGLVFRRRLRSLRLGLVSWVTAIACLPGCSCDNKNACGDTACMDGALKPAIGRWSSIAGDDQRVLVATYDEAFGDLVVADVTDPTAVKLTTVDGVTPGFPPTYDPSTYRGGVEDPGPKVGAWTSIALADHSGRVAYQDRDQNQLKYAYETDGSWASYALDTNSGEKAGLFTSVLVDSDDHPVIAYMSLGGDDGMGHKTSELKLARAGAPKPDATDWVISTIASQPMSCAGLCGAGDVCIAGDTAQVCAATTSDCTAACGAGDACVSGSCQTIITDPGLDDLPTGTGLFAHVVLLPDGRLAIASYDQVRRALVLNVESAKGTSTFAETILDGNATGADRGMWLSAMVAGDGTVHLSYQDALADTLMYTTWNGAAGTPEIVDDGQRQGDRPHNVGAASAIYFAAGQPAIAYQDGMTSDVYVATKGGMWTTNGLATGPLLDGFSIAATNAHSNTPFVAWGTKDPAADPISSLTVQKP